MNVNIDGDNISLINIYGPNVDDPGFVQEISNVIDNYAEGHIILGGDFNIVQDFSLDKFRGRLHTNFAAKKELFALQDNFDLVDIWRDRNPDAKRYTWVSNHSPPIFCRIDFFLVSFGLISRIDNAYIVSGFKSDHSLIPISFTTGSEPRGPGFWKLNSSLLNDTNYLKELKEVIHSSALDNAPCNPALRWEMVKCSIRGFC